MSKQISLKEVERKAFRASFDDGLWDVLLGCVVLMFAIAPFLSASLGDFWSSAIFLPFWALAFLVVWLVRRRVVAPRTGFVKLGRARMARLMKFSLLMLALNVVAFALGLAAAMTFGRVSGLTTTIIFGLIVLIGFSLAAYFLNFSRLYVYGLLIGLAPLVGEWLYLNMNAPHHGFPITFGIAAGTIITVGLVVFVRLLHDNPVPVEGAPPEKA